MNHKQEIENAVKKFRSKVETIRNSDHPKYKDKEVAEYEIKAERATLDATVAELSNAYDKAIAQEIEQAEEKAKTSRFHTSEASKQQAEHALDAFVADVTLAYDDNGKHSAYATLERRLDNMTAAELSHVRLRLPQILQRVGNDEIATKKLKSLNATLAALKTEEQERLDELKAQKVSGADGAYRRLRMIHPSYNDFRDNIARMKN